MITIRKNTFNILSLVFLLSFVSFSGYADTTSYKVNYITEVLAANDDTSNYPETYNLSLTSVSKDIVETTYSQYCFYSFFRNQQIATNLLLKHQNKMFLDVKKIILNQNLRIYLSSEKDILS